nr:acyl-ACP thioesterase domain-containing protein [Paenibacillus caui]
MSDADFRMGCRLSVLLDMLQQAADSAANDLGINWRELLAAGMGWMLMTLDLDVRRIPKLGETLSIRTWSKGTKGPLWQRDYRVFGAEEEEVAAGRSIWALVDIHKRRILRPTALPVQVEAYTGDSVGNMPEKVAIPQNIELSEAFQYEVRYSGLDINGHLNNARYADLCYDALTAGELQTLDLRRFQITYIKESKRGDNLCILRSALTDGRIFIRGQAEDTVYFEACLHLG